MGTRKILGLDEDKLDMAIGERTCEVILMKMLLCILFITLTVGQLHGQDTLTNAATRACHRTLAGLADKDSTLFSTWGEAKASATLDEIEKCARESYTLS
jgi:hypothetical protein